MIMYNLSSDNCTSTSSINPPITYYSSSQGFPHKTSPSNDTCFSLFHPPSPLFMSYEDEALLFPYLQNLANQEQPFSIIEDFNVPVSNQEMMDGDLSKTKNNNDGNGKIPLKIINTIGENKLDDKCPKKKCYKKDRHSKIITSRGPRDRRMRLSLEVAPKFFNLQEMLGFDKASQTLEWLMNKSQWAIMEISRKTTTCDDANSVPLVSSSTYSELCDNEVISSSSNVVEEQPPEGLGNMKGGNKSSTCTNKKLKNNEKTRRPIRPFAKKTREEARERARKRTLNKKQVVKYNDEEAIKRKG